MPSTTAKSHRAETVFGHLATEIRAEMVRHGETITSAGEHFGISHASISRKLSGAFALTVLDLIGFADWLGVTAAELLTRAEAAAAANRRPTRRPGRAA